MFKSLKNKLFGEKENIKQQEQSIEEPVTSPKPEKQQQKQQQQEQQEQPIEVRVDFDEVISKLDNLTNLVKEETKDMNTYQSLQHDSNLLAPDDELELVEAEQTLDLKRIVKEHKEKLINDSEEIKRNSDTYQINEGMFELNNQLDNAKLIIEDTNIPEPITKEDVLEK